MRGVRFLAILLLVPVGVCGQRPGSVTVGQLVRLSTDSVNLRTVTGTLVGQDSAAIQVAVYRPRRWADPYEPDSAIVTLPWTHVREVAVRTGRRSAADKGALIGLAVGAGLGLSLGIAASSDPWFHANGGDVALVTMQLGVIGAGVGALMGLALGTERWEVVESAGRRAVIAPRGTGVMIAASFPF